jgi:hypothetical protein
MEESNSPPEWLETLPEEMRAVATLHKFKDVAGLAKSYTELEGKMGNALRIPGEDAGEEAHKAFAEDLRNKYNNASPYKLGYLPDESDPESVKLYQQQLGVPEEAKLYPDAEGLQEDTAQRTKELAHAAGLTPAQYKSMSEWLAKEAGEVQETMEAHKQENLKAITEKLGTSTDQRISRIESVARGKGMEVSMEGAPAPVVLLLDSLLDDIQGKGPQGQNINGVEVGPNKSEIEARIAERRTRLIEEQYKLTRPEYVRLQEANIRDMEQLQNM